jgi:hypothetical protein
MKTVLAVVVIVLIGVAWAGGYWPERQRRVAAEAEASALRGQLAAAEARVRAAALLGDLLALRDEVSARNYGQAQEFSTRFFDRVRAEAARTSEAGLGSALQGILDTRDAVTSALTKAEPGALDLLVRLEVRLRSALGYPVKPVPIPGEPAPSPTPSPSAVS